MVCFIYFSISVFSVLYVHNFMQICLILCTKQLTGQQEKTVKKRNAKVYL